MNTNLAQRVTVIVLLTIIMAGLIKADSPAIDNPDTASKNITDLVANETKYPSSAESFGGTHTDEPSKDRFAEYKNSFEGKALGLFSDLMACFMMTSMFVLFAQWVSLSR